MSGMLKTKQKSRLVLEDGFSVINDLEEHTATMDRRAESEFIAKLKASGASESDIKWYLKNRNKLQ